MIILILGIHEIEKFEGMETPPQQAPLPRQATSATLQPPAFRELPTIPTTGWKTEKVYQKRFSEFRKFRLQKS